MKLSVCIICKNEAAKIEQCLQSVSFADEIIVLDSGSTDDTVEIARRYTDNVHVRTDWNGFGEQRQRAEQLATNDWIFAIDCDEVVPDELAQEIQSKLKECTDDTVLYVNRLTHFCGQFIYHSGWYPSRIARIYNKRQYGYDDKMVHESVACKGARRVDLQHDLLHYQYDDLFEYLNKRNRYADASANEKMRRGKSSSLTRATLASLFAFIKHYFFKRGFLDGRIGFVISVIQAQYTFNKYMFLQYKKPAKK